jgi:transposase
VQQRGFGSDIKRQALMLYLHGLCFRSIGQLLQCSHVTVHNWIKTYGEEIDDIRSEAGVEIIKIDDMHSHIDTKTKRTSGFLLIDMENHNSPALCVAKKKAEKNDAGKILTSPNKET